MTRPKEQKRALRAAYMEAKQGEGQTFNLFINGRTLRDANDVQVRVNMEWYFIPHIVEQLKTLWIKEKSRRESEIKRIDQSLAGVPV
jgi:hypothetical protein